MYGFVIVGKQTSGKWKDQWVIMSTPTENSLAPSMPKAEVFLERIQNYYKGVSRPEIDMNSLMILPVGTIGPMIYNL